MNSTISNVSMTPAEMLSTDATSEWSDDQWMNFKAWLEGIMMSETVEVIFTKVDGTERVMNCTMDYQVIDAGVKLLAEARAQQTKAEPDKPRQKPRPNPANLTVWDTTVGDWRSFRVRSITNRVELILKYLKNKNA